MLAKAFIILENPVVVPPISIVGLAVLALSKYKVPIVPPFPIHSPKT